jgi:hypothetical protein
MEPFYITGQKRVGKTSLALAAVKFASEHAVGRTLHDINILSGYFANADAKQALAELGRRIEEYITEHLPYQAIKPKYSFDGTLSPIVRLSEFARKNAPNDQFVVIIDEFDEIHQDLYLSGNLAETFFANIRAISTTSNVCFVLVGGENMPFIMERQGEKLNKFTRQNLSYFSRASEWEDFVQLVTRPTDGVIRWSDDAVSAIFNETNGNPYFTNLVCGRVLREAVRSRDADVTATEVQNALEAEVSALDANSFAHLWHDGILKPIAEREPDVVRRRRVLVCLARCARKHLPLKQENLLDKKNNTSLSNGEIVATLNEFVWRRVLIEADGEYKFFLPIFERWLTQDGLAIVQPDAVSEELAASVQADEDAAFVRSDEIVALVKPWSTYQGRHIGTDDVRAWYEQVDGHREQRLLFKLLLGIKFVSDAEMREKASSAFVQLSKQLDEFVRHSLADRRTDVLLTYLDGHGKSGEYITSLFAEVNKISVSQICSQIDVGARLIAAVQKGNPISAVIIVDDIAGTGRTLASSVGKFVAGTQVPLRMGNTKILTCALYATRAATEYALASCRAIEHVECVFRAGEVLSQKSFAFSDESPLWANQDERERARALATDLGSRIYRSQPLGFGGMGLLIVFPTTIPNNTLPILHSSSKSGLKPWRPLFPRPTN